MDIKVLVTQMTVLFLIMFLGYFIYKIKMVNDSFVKMFSRLLLDVTLPAMILASVLNLEERQPSSDVITALLIATALFFIILPVLGFILSKLIMAKKEDTGLFTFMNTYSNIGFMGMPVINALCGPVGLFYAAIFNLVFNLSIYSFGIWMMNKGNKNAVKFTPQLLCTPGIIIAALSIILYFSNIHFPAIITDTVTSVGQITSPAAMLLIGCTLASMDIKSVFNEWRIYPWTIIKQVAIPLILWFPLSMIIKNEMLLTVTYILTAMPVANSAALFATTYGGNTNLAAKSIFLTTLFSLITVPVVIILVM